MNTSRQNPYIGPRKFETSESHLFFGREREGRDLLSLVISERLVLFYAQSGAGKSSLVNTKLIPGLLSEEEYRVLPVGRVGGGETSTELNVKNIYVYNLITSLVQHDIDRETIAKQTLTEFIADLENDPKDDLKRVLIIDQFEELFSTYPEAWEKREDFLKQLSQAMSNLADLWVVLVMREDYIASLDPYVYMLPGKVRVRYYMQRLEHEAALQAVKKPVEAIRPFTEGVAERLVDDLSSIRVQRLDGTLAIQPGQFIEPVQLQVVCYSLWESLSPDGKSITDKDLQEVGDVSQTLEKHYANRVKDVAENKGVSERAIREWIESKLITSSGMRNMVMREVRPAHRGLHDSVIQSLQSDLIRAEKRGGTTFYELTHDRLVEPIVINNRKWEMEHSTLLQRQAKLWEEQGRSDGVLLRGKDLVDAEAEVKKIEPSDLEQSFLIACHALEARETRERYRIRLMTIFAIAATIAMLAAFYFAFRSKQSEQAAQVANTQAFEQKSTAEAASTKAIEQNATAEWYADRGLARQLVQQSKYFLNSDYDLALLLGIEAYHLGKDIPETRGNLLTNLNSLSLITILSAHKDNVRGLNFSPDGKILASGSWDKTVTLWDVTDPLKPRQIGSPLTFGSSVQSVIFSPDGKTIAVGVWKTISLWDVSDPQHPRQLSEFSGHSDWIDEIAFSPDGRILGSCSDDDTVILWDISDLQAPSQIGEPLTVHKDWVASIVFSPDGSLLATGSGDRRIILWNVSLPEKPVQVGNILLDSAAQDILFSPDGKTLVSSDWETIDLWDVTDPWSPTRIGQTLSGHSDWVRKIAISPDGKTLVSGGDDDLIIVWDIANLAYPTKKGFLLGHTNFVRSLAFGPNGMIASGGKDRTIRLWDTATPMSPAQLGTPLAGQTMDVLSVALSADGSLLASGSSDRKVILWDLSDPEKIVPLGDPLAVYDDWVRSVAFNPRAGILATGGDDKKIVLWDVSKKENITQIGMPLFGHTDWIKSVAFSPDGKLMASGDDDQKILLWDVSNKEQIALNYITLSGHTSGVHSVAFNSDGKVLASGSFDKTVILWGISNPRHAEQLNTLSGHQEGVNSVAFNYVHPLLATGSSDDTVILWDISDPKHAHMLGIPLTAHTDDINTVVFSSDGNLLATGSDDNTIILWDVSNPLLPIQIGKPLLGHTENVNSLAFSPNGRLLFSGSEDNTVRVWNIDPQYWIKRTCEVVMRNLTLEEWKSYLPGQEYHVETCPEKIQ